MMNYVEALRKISCAYEKECVRYRGGSRAGLWGGHNCLFRVKGFLTLFFAEANIVVSGA